MSLSDINLYIGLKATLVSQVASDDTVDNINTTLASIVSKNADVLGGLSSSTVLDDGSGVSTSDKMNFIATVNFCKYGDSDLNLILISWYDKINDEMTNATDPTIIAALTDKFSAITTILVNTIAGPRQDLVKFIVEN